MLRSEAPQGGLGPIEKSITAVVRTNKPFIGVLLGIDQLWCIATKTKVSGGD